MPVRRQRARKHFRRDPAKIRRAQRALLKANQRFVKSGILIKDVYGNLDE